MRVITIPKIPGFSILSKTSRSQAAVLVLAAGEKIGGPQDNLPDSDHWLYVVSGEGRAVVCGAEVPLHPGSLLLIERGENNEIEAYASGPLNTINIYTPSAY